MTTTAQPTTATAPATNPHLVGYWITLIAIPIVFIGALWGAGNQPEHAGSSGTAFLAIIVLHLVKRVQRNRWNRKHGVGK